MALSFKVGSYIGDGSSPKTISGIGFQPKVVIISAANAGSAGDPRASIWKTDTMSTGASGITANFGENGQQTAGLIDTLNSDGFTVRDTKNANGTTYYYVALGGDDVKTGTYTGNLTARSITGVGFQPGWVVIEGHPSHTYHKNSGTGNGVDKSQFTTAVADTTNQIKSLDADGFSLGTGSGTNNSGTTYHYFAIKNDSAYFYSGTYTGNSTSGKTVTGIGFQPEFVVTKNVTTDQGCFVTSAHASGYASLMRVSDPTTNIFNSLDSDGFTLGSNAASNQTATYYFIAMKTPGGGGGGGASYIPKIIMS